MKYLALLIILLFAQSCYQNIDERDTVNYYFNILNETESDVTIKLLEPYFPNEKNTLDENDLAIDSVTFILPPQRTIVFHSQGKSDKFDSQLRFETGGTVPLWEHIDYIKVTDTIYDRRLWCSENRWHKKCQISYCFCTDYSFSISIK